MKTIRITIIIVVVIISSCKTKQESNTISLAFNSALPKDSSTFYFPLNTFYKDTSENNRNADQVTNKWYSKILFNMNEPILSSYHGESEAIRFIWLRTFNEPIVVRLNNTAEGVFAILKTLEGHSGFKTGKIKIDTVIMLDKVEWTKSIDELNGSNFWAISTECESTGKDGVDWILEVKSKDKYHFINRWDDGNMQSNDLKLFCSQLITLCTGVVDLRSNR